MNYVFYFNYDIFCLYNKEFIGKLCIIFKNLGIICIELDLRL